MKLLLISKGASAHTCLYVYKLIYFSLAFFSSIILNEALVASVNIDGNDNGNECGNAFISSPPATDAVFLFGIFIIFKWTSWKDESTISAR